MSGRSLMAVFSGITMAVSCHADIDPLTGLDFAIIDHPSNPPWQAAPGDVDDQTAGRGRVDYVYRISKTEVPGWLYTEFLAATRELRVGHVPYVGTPTVNGSGNHLVGGITWREAAIFCNWMHNGRLFTRDAFLSGVYDVSTFGSVDPFGFTDQPARSPDARYFLPTWDEWLKAVHYDPHKVNADGTIGGWWQYANMRDQPLIYAPPVSWGGNGTGMANAGFNLPGFAERGIPLGSYPTQRSPWGLLDTAGGMTEWLETGYINPLNGILEGRYSDGSGWGSSLGTAMGSDAIRFRGGELPNIGWSDFGFRIAATVLPGTPVCDTVDFNRDELFPDTQDIADFLEVFSGAPCPAPVCGDVDFNRDGLFPDTEDIAAFLRVFAGGQCIE